jgi:hypothetical protein
MSKFLGLFHGTVLGILFMHLLIIIFCLLVCVTAMALISFIWSIFKQLSYILFEIRREPQTEFRAEMIHPRDIFEQTNYDKKCENNKINWKKEGF